MEILDLRIIIIEIKSILEGINRNKNKQTWKYGCTSIEMM